jgi:capsid protein
MNRLLKLASRFLSFTFGWYSPYDSANWSPRRGFVPGAAPGDAKRDLSPGIRKELVRRARYLQKNSGFVRELVGNMAIYSTGDGIKPQAQSPNQNWNRAAEEYFANWSAQCEITRRFSFAECQSLVCRGIDVDGEYFIHKTRDTAQRPVLQLIESHRIGDELGSAETVDGIGLDNVGAPLFYRLILDDGTYRDLPAASVLHVFEPESISAVRHPATIQHSINHVIDEIELLALEKHAVKDNADVARVLKTGRGELDESGDFSLRTEDKLDEASDPLALQRIIGGKLVALKPDESLDSFQSNRPSPTFTGFLTHLRRDSALGVLPYEFAADSSSIGGAGVRLVVAKAGRRFSYRQLILTQRMLRPVWGYVIGDAIATGALPAVTGWWKVRFQRPAKVSVDAGREAQQNRADVEMGLKTLEESYAEMGLDFEEQAEIRAQNARFLLDLAEKYKVPLELLWKPSGGTAATPVVGEQEDPPAISGIRQPG